MRTATTGRKPSEDIAGGSRAASGTRAIPTRWENAIPIRGAHGGATTIELRLAHAGDAVVVRRVADLDSAPTLTGPVLIASVDGDAVAAVSLLDQRVIADPFVCTRDAVALLRLRAEHLSGTYGQRGHRRGLGRRAA